jgi:hypothetical protein
MGSRTRLLTSLALLVACGLAAQEPNLIEQRRNLPARVGPHAIKGHDRPDLRRDWNLQWFGGRLSPEYLDYKNRTAALEMRRWAQQMPQAPGNKRLPAIIGTAAAPSGTGGAWSNLGPTGNLVDASWPDHDSGRPSAIAVDPASNTLYLASSGGGVWKCANADPNAAGDWTWAPITDGLPNSGSSGNVSAGALALSPANSQVLYLGLGDAHGAEGRGFYTSTNGGTSWAESTGIGAQTRSYFILPVDANVVLWGTNDGLKRSTNGGGTFNPVTGGPGTALVQVWSIQPFSATELICSVQDTSGSGSIYYSIDAGATWTQATLGGLGTIAPGRMTLTSVPAGTSGYAEVEDTKASAVARGVLVTSDKGHVWAWQAATMETGGLFQGTGPSMKSDGGQEWYNQAIAVDPTNPSRLIMGANLAMYRSMNGGVNWQQLTHWYGSGHVYSHADFHTVTYKNGTFYLGNDGGLSIFKDPWRASIPTSNPDLTFVDSTRNKGLVTHLVYNVGSTAAASPADSKWRASLGLQDNGTRIRQPNTQGNPLTGTEGTFEDRIGGDGFATLIHPTNGNLILGSIYYTDIYKATDGGATPTSFVESVSGLTNANSSSLAPFQPRLALGDAGHPDTVYTATNGTVFKSTNFGDTWTGLGTAGLPPGGTGAATDPADALYIRNIGAASSDANVLGIAANQGRFFFTANGGSSWTQGGTPANNGSYTSYVWFDRVTPTTVYAASVAPVATKNHLWKSTNSGASWTAIDGSASASNGFPFGIPVHVVQTDPADPNTLYAGTDFGVYVSSNGGTSWARFGSGLPMVAVRDLYLAPDGSFIRAATFGRGVWEVSNTPVGPSVSLDKTTVVVSPSATTNFTATVTNFASDNKVNWTASAGGGSLSPTQTATAVATTYTAPATPGIYTVTAASNELPTATALATVNVYTPAAVTVAVTPGTRTLVTGGSYTFAATVTNAPSAAVTWTASGGTITAGGAYTAPATAGSYTVTATSVWPGTTAGTATVTVKSRDLDGNGTVEPLDLLFFAKYYGTTNAACDLNGDGTVNDADLDLLIAGL